MLSISVIKNAGAAYSYYETDNYYAKESPEAMESSSWWGEGAKRLALNGHIDAEQFKLLLEGQLPNGQQLGRIEKGEVEHRPGYDLTFSAPKSVSILSEIGGDKRIYAAHDKAVNEALGYLQNHASQTRQSHDGKITFTDTHNFIVAKFRHDTSREQDPQLHTHCVVINATERADGQWRSLSSEKLFDYKMLTGLMYRSVLAVELKELGYDINKTHQDGRFEISSIPQDIIDIFSKRRHEIEKTLEERGLEGSKASEIAALNTRQSKQVISREVLHQQWQSQCKSHEFNVDQIVNNAIEKTKATQPLPKITQNNLNRNDAQDSVRHAYQHLSEREAVFTHQSLLTVALAHSIGNILPHKIENAIKQLQDKKELILINRDGMDAHCWTTPSALKLEKDTIHQMLDGRYTVKPVISIEKIEQYLSGKSHLNNSQKDAIKLILATPDRITGVQGYAGTGKTTMLSAVKELAQAQGFEVKGIAPSATAANQLKQEAGIESVTLDSYFIEQAKQGNLIKSASKVIYVLDESSMASTSKMSLLLKSIHQNKGRIVLVGDSKQLGAIEAGKPFYQLQKAGMQTAIMKDILRQKDTDLLQAVHQTIKGDIQAAFHKIKDKIIEIEDKNKRIERLANDYLALSPQKREKALVLTPANEDRITTNQFIRNGLKQEGILTGDETNMQVLTNRGFTRAERIVAENYKTGDIVRFNKSYTSLNIKSGEYLEVMNIDKENNQITLKNSKNNTIAWFPHEVGGKREGAIEIYQPSQCHLMLGDTIRWQRNDKTRGMINSETAKVTNIKNNIATVELNNGKAIRIDTTDRTNQHWDYAYATTVHAAQGKTCDIVLAHGESFRKNLTSQHGFYVTISRARYDAYIYTDNKQEYLKTLNKYTGERTSALEDWQVNASENISSIRNNEIGVKFSQVNKEREL